MCFFVLALDFFSNISLCCKDIPPQSQSQRSCKYGQRCGCKASRGFVAFSVSTRRGQLLCHGLSPQQQATVKSERQLDKEALASACFVCRLGLLLSLAKGRCSLSQLCTRSAFLGVAGGLLPVGVITSDGHEMSIDRAVDRWALPSSTCLLFQYWESFSWSLLKPARPLCKVSALRRVGLQAIKSLHLHTYTSADYLHERRL